MQEETEQHKLDHHRSETYPLVVLRDHSTVDCNARELRKWRIEIRNVEVEKYETESIRLRSDHKLVNVYLEQAQRHKDLLLDHQLRFSRRLPFPHTCSHSCFAHCRCIHVHTSRNLQVHWYWDTRNSLLNTVWLRGVDRQQNDRIRSNFASTFCFSGCWLRKNKQRTAVFFVV